MVEKCSMKPDRWSGWIQDYYRIRGVILFDSEYVYIIQVDDERMTSEMFY